jgi:hypothetical protein
MDELRGKLTFAVTLMVTATLCLVMLGIIFALLMGLYSADVDNAEIFKEITPVLQTITGGFIGLLAGIKLSQTDDSQFKENTNVGTRCTTASGREADRQADT